MSRRQKLFRIIDEDGGDNFIAADNYAEAVKKFMEFIAEENNEPCEDTIESVMFVGYLLGDPLEGKERES